MINRVDGIIMLLMVAYVDYAEILFYNKPI